MLAKKLQHAMQPKGVARCYRRMTALLYWIVYNFDLGPLGPRVLNLAVQSWLKRAKDERGAPVVRQRVLGWLTVLHLQPSFGTDERM
jgi:hypothetical protein